MTASSVGPSFGECGTESGAELLCVGFEESESPGDLAVAFSLALGVANALENHHQIRRVDLESLVVTETDHLSVADRIGPAVRELTHILHGGKCFVFFAGEGSPFSIEAI